MVRDDDIERLRNEHRTEHKSKPLDYMVITLIPEADGRFPVRYSAKPPTMWMWWRNECRTTEMWFRYIPAGTFLMGSPSNEKGRNTNDDISPYIREIDYEIQHPVTLTQPYYMGIFTVSNAQCLNVTGNERKHPAHWHLNDGLYEESRKKFDPLPCDNYSYDDIRGRGNEIEAQSFMGIMRAKTGLLADLPTEAQWEYACRANMTENELRRLANHGRNWISNRHPIGALRPNNWGIYDILTSVWQYCRDDFAPYPHDVQIDPCVYLADETESRVRRGGASTLRVATRSYYHETSRQTGVGWTGFRVVIQMPCEGINDPMCYQHDGNLVSGKFHTRG